jgi:hypothetical protein
MPYERIATATEISHSGENEQRIIAGKTPTMEHPKITDPNARTTQFRQTPSNGIGTIGKCRWIKLSIGDRPGREAIELMGEHPSYADTI